jgi:hypothetical protein
VLGLRSSASLGSVREVALQRAGTKARLTLRVLISFRVLSKWSLRVARDPLGIPAAEPA